MRCAYLFETALCRIVSRTRTRAAEELGKGGGERGWLNSISISVSVRARVGCDLGACRCHMPTNTAHCS